MPIRKPWNHEVVKFDNRGLDLIHPVDQVDAQHYSRFINVKSVQEGSLQPRPGSSLVNASVLEAPPQPIQEGQAVRVHGDGTASTSHSLGPPNYSFANNRLYLICIHNEGAALPTASGLSGGSITWVEEASVTYNTVGTPLSKIQVFRGLVTSGATTSTVSYTTDVACPTFFSIHEFTGIDLTGTSGSGAVRQSVTNNQDAGAGPGVSATLAAFLNSESATFATLSCDDGNRFWAPVSPMTEIHDSGAGGTLKHTSIFYDAADLTPESTLDSDRDAGIIALELQAA